MRLLIAMGFGLCLFTAITPCAIAQYQNPEWLELAPAGDSFQVLMPNQSRVEKENVQAVNGNRYIALTGIATYTVWSLTNAKYQAEQDTDASLDMTAELLWDGLLKAPREQLDEKARRLASMSYVRELPPAGLPGREYMLTVGDVNGTAQFYVAQEHIYVLLVMGKAGEDWPREKFFASFHATSSPVAAAPAQPLENGGSVPPAPTATDAEDYNRVFSGREVTQKVRILDKPEPTYTESARKFSVQGTVIFRAVFSKSAEVTNVNVKQKLPHGLTQRAMTAARAIRFTPAIKDGHPVSMWMELQYNFNLY